MKLILLSDLHILFDRPEGRKDDILQTMKKKMTFILEYANTHGFSILQAGDFFDVPRSWRLLPLYIELLKYWGVDIYVVYGQHDTYLYSEGTRDRTMVGVLAKMGVVKILDKEGTRFDANTKVYGTSYGQEVPIPNKTVRTNILVIHAPILKKKIWEGQEGSSYADEYLRMHKEYDLILCGDIHQKFLFEEDGRTICNTGCILRKSVDQWDYIPGFYVYDTETKETKWQEIPHSPPEEVMSREHLDQVESKNKMLEEFISTVKNRGGEKGISFKDVLLQVLEENKIEEEVKEALSEVMEEGK